MRDIKSIHFVGIGGSGLSAMANFFSKKGIKISGSNNSDIELLDSYRKQGWDIFIGHNAKNIRKDIDLVVYTKAIKKIEDNEEISYCIDNGIPVKSYPEVLSDITNDYKTIGIAGTHGKTSSACLLTELMQELKPNALFGADSIELGTNSLVSGSDLFILEADEYKNSFSDYDLDVLVILNLEHDHFDVYPKLDDMKKVFIDRAKLMEGKTIVADLSDKEVVDILKGIDAKIIDYSQYEKYIEERPGIFVKNCAAVLAVALEFGLDKEKMLEKIKNWKGVARRFELKGVTKEGTKIYDDYAHHSTAIEKVLKSFREKYKKKNIVVVCEPQSVF